MGIIEFGNINMFGVMEGRFRLRCRCKVEVSENRKVIEYSNKRLRYRGGKIIVRGDDD